MSAPPYQKLFWGSYHKHTAHLSHAREHGAYLLLIGALWNNEGRLPADDDTLAGYAKLTVKEWLTIKPKLVNGVLLKIIRGKLTQPRVTEDLAKYRDTSGKRKQAGKSGGLASAGKPKGKRTANATVLPTKPEPEPEEGSVPNGTGETPSSNDPPDDLAELRALEPKAAAWAVSRKVLCERGGLSRAKAGEIVGKLFRDHGLSPGELWEAAEATWRAGTEDPVPYLTRLCVSAAAKRGGADLLEPSERQQIAWMEDWIESPANWRGTRGPRPGEPGCRVRPEIQYRFGVQPSAANDGSASKTNSGEAA